MTSWTGDHAHNIHCIFVPWYEISQIRETKKERKITIKSREKKGTRSERKTTFGKCVFGNVVSPIWYKSHSLHGSTAKLEQEFIMDVHHKYEAKLLRINGTEEEDFHLWSVKVEAVLKSQALPLALCDENVHYTVDKQAKAIINASMGNNLLRAIQDCQSIKLACEKLETCYASKSTTNKLVVLNKLLYTKLRNYASMGDHISHLEAQYSRLVAMHSGFLENVKIALRL